MKRYCLYDRGCGDLIEDLHGGWVRFTEAQAEIDKRDARIKELEQRVAEWRTWAVSELRAAGVVCPTPEGVA